MSQFYYQQLLRQLTRHGGLYQRHINYARRICWKRRFATESNGKPAVCIVGSGPAGFYTAQYLLKVVNVVGMYLAMQVAPGPHFPPWGDFCR